MRSTHLPSKLAVSAMFAMALVLGERVQAQSPPSQPAAKQERVSVVFVGSKQLVRGRLLRLDATTLAIDVTDETAAGQSSRRTMSVPIDRVLRVDVEHHDSLVDGAIVGALYLAACARWWCGQGSSGPPHLPRDIWIGAGLGAAVGAAIDSAFYRQTTIFKAGNAGTTSSKRIGLAFTVRF